MSTLSNVSVGVSVNAGQAVREVAGFTKTVEKLAGTLGRFTSMSKGTGGHGSVTQMSREMELYGRAAKRANDDLKALLATQAKLQQQKIGATGEALKGLEQQERYVNRRVSQASVRASSADLRYESARAGGTAPDPGDHGGGGGSHGGFAGQAVRGLAEGASSELGGPLGAIGGAALTLQPELLALAVIAAIGAAAVKVGKEAVSEQIKLADFLPRVGGEGMENRFTTLRRGAAAYGFSPEETLAAAGNVSLGGSTLKNGLARDVLATAALSRAFGMDLGGVSALTGQAGRMGGFHPGDARKFAEMLANAFHKTGMDPRANEILEGTLTLMNRQMMTMPSANPAAALAMQTMFNKTGIPAFQGAAGAGLLAQMQAKMTGPMDDEHMAFFQMAVRKAGLGKSLEDMVRLHEKGPLGEPRLFAAVAGLANDNLSHFTRMMAFSENAGIPFLKAEALDRKYGLANIASGKYTHAAMASLKGGDVLHEGALKASELPGNVFRSFSAYAENAVIDTGNLSLGPLTGLARAANDKAAAGYRFADAPGSLGEKLFALDWDRIPPPADARHNRIGKQATNPEMSFGVPASPRHNSVSSDDFQPIPLPAGVHIPRPRSLPVLPPVLKLEVSHTGAVTGDGKRAFKAMVKQAIGELERDWIEAGPSLSYRRP